MNDASAAAIGAVSAVLASEGMRQISPGNENSLRLAAPFALLAGLAIRFAAPPKYSGAGTVLAGLGAGLYAYAGAKSLYRQSLTKAP